MPLKQSTKEVVLFFKKNTKYDIDDITTEITKRYPDLGVANILSYESGTGMPLFYHGGDPDMVLSADYSSLSIIVHEKYFDALPVIVFDMVDIFAEVNVKFVRMGYVSSFYEKEEDIESIRDRYLKTDNIGDIHEFDIGWYKNLKAHFGNINCWEKLITERGNIRDLLCQYDCNTPIDQIFNFEMKNIKEFFKVADNYVLERYGNLKGE